MRKIFAVLAGLLLVAVAVQFYLAAVGAFAKPQDDSSYSLHGLNGAMIIPLLSILATVAAALARAPGRLVGLTIVPFGLVFVQYLIIVIGNAFTDEGDYTTPAALAVLGLHAINGLAIMGVTGSVFRLALALAKQPRVIAAPASESVPA